MHCAEIMTITNHVCQLKDVTVNYGVDTKKKAENDNETGNKRASEHSLRPAWPAWLATASQSDDLGWSSFSPRPWSERPRHTFFANQELRHLFVKKSENLFELMPVRRYIK